VNNTLVQPVWRWVCAVFHFDQRAGMSTTKFFNSAEQRRPTAKLTDN
jgi:hypothetical protein